MGLVNTSPMWFINCPSVVQCFLLAQLHLTLPECSARASPSASLSDPEQHMILVKSQVTQCYSTLSSSAPARQERGQWETQGKAKHRMKGAGWCGALHLRMRSWKILFGGEKRMTVWFWKESWWTAQEKAPANEEVMVPGPFARNSQKIHSWSFI